MGRVYRSIADLVLGFHIFVVAIILFGWFLPHDLFWMYQTTVILTFLFGIINRGTCILTKYEWGLRRKYHLGDYDDNLFIPYYLKKYLHINISENIWSFWVGVFITVSFLLQIYLLLKR